MRKVLGSALVSMIAVAGAQAAPAVTMEVTQNIGGSGNTAYDFFYTPSVGEEFTNYRLIIQTTNGANILDPIRGANGQQDQGSDAIDTFANTVYSLLGAGNASHIFTSYNPAGLSPDAVPTSFLDWSVFDTGIGDNAGAGSGAPFHLARVLTTADATGTASFVAFDTANDGPDSGGYANNFNLVPEPGSLALLGLGGLALMARRRRSA